MLFCCLSSTYIFGHNLNIENAPPRHWHLPTLKKTIEGSFLMLKNGSIYIEDANSRVLHFPLQFFSAEDQKFALHKNEWINQINKEMHAADNLPASNDRFFIVGILLLCLWLYIIVIKKNNKIRYFTPVPAFGLLLIIYGFKGKEIRSVFSTTNPLTMDSAFTPFKPNVYTRWDNNYFYVESKGIPNHGMMTGITSWQQQVPIPQCYVDSNAWSIPLNPVLATTPVPVNQQHFLRGAIAVAANGIAIFNPYTNTGVDAFLDGQLDNWGGHCGRADDYHYHIAPLHLYTSGQTSATLPVAYALDGFAVYGSKEPDGITPMTLLDTNHGHYGVNGVYHYHGTAVAPYMIGNMVGQVTEDSTLQIIPQARAYPVRPALTPLSGATITGCISNGNNNGYNLTYSRMGQNYSVDYSWTSTGNFTYNFISPAGTTTSTYNNKPGHNCIIKSGPLPLSVVSFTAKQYNNKVLLNWSTSNPFNTKSCIVERSTDGISWTVLESLPSVNTSGLQSYSFSDEAPKSKNYYRIKFLDIDGKFTFSNIRIVELIKSETGLIIYPNPTNNEFLLRWNNEIQEKDVQQVSIFNLNGEKVFESKQHNNKIEIKHLSKGTYLVNITLSKSKLNKKLIIQ